MPYTIDQKDNKATLTVTIPKEDVDAGMMHAAEHLAKETKIPGFRPGKASYEVVKQRVGEMKILEAALEELVRAHFVKAMLEENLETVGQPFFNVDKMAPGNDLIFTAEIALYPQVTKMADYKKLSVKREDTKPTSEQIDTAKRDLARMKTKEVRAKSGAELKAGDKGVLALGMKEGGVVLEGGESQNHAVYTAEEHYIPGFIDQIFGLKEGGTKTFDLDFPKDHYQKHLAGKKITFDIELKEIHELEVPELNDLFAKALGFKDLGDFETKLMENLEAENADKESARSEKAVLELISQKSTFDTIPDLLVNQEIDKMMEELKHHTQQQGMDFDTYLAQIKKTLAEIKLDFTPTALERIKVAILLKNIAKEEDIKPAEKDVDDELDKMADYYKDNEEMKKNIFTPQYRDYVEYQLKNRAVIAFLKETILK